MRIADENNVTIGKYRGVFSGTYDIIGGVDYAVITFHSGDFGSLSSDCAFWISFTTIQPGKYKRNAAVVNSRSCKRRGLHPRFLGNNVNFDTCCGSMGCPIVYISEKCNKN